MANHRGLTAEQWTELRAAYESGESVSALSRKYGVRRHTIAARSQREAWTVQPTVQVDTKAVQRNAQATVISLATRKVVEQAVADGMVEAVAAELTEALQLHSSIELLMLKFAEDTLKRSLGADGTVPLREGTHTSEAGERKDAMAAAAMAIDKSRELRGKRPGVPTVDADAADGKPQVIEFVVVDGPEEQQAS